MVTKKKDTTAKGVGTVAVVGLVGWGIYQYLQTREGEVLIVPAIPPITPIPGVEDDSAALYQDSLDALARAQAALEETQAAAALQATTQHEQMLALQESLAILQPVVITTEVIDSVGEGQVPTIVVTVDPSEAARLAAEAEAQAQAQREELKRRWQDALNIAESTLPVMRANAEAGVRLYEQKQAKVQSVLDEIEKYKNAIMLTNTGIQNTTSQAVRDRLLINHKNYMIQYNAAKAQLVLAKGEATAKKSDAYALIGIVNQGIERVLTITADLAIITYVAAIANRVDAIARSTREAVGNLQGRLTGVEAALIYDEPIDIQMVYISPPVPVAPVPTAVEVAAAAEREVWGITVEEVKSLQDLALEVNIELGGRYIGGLLTPPPSWTGSVTAWSKHIQEVALARFKQQ